MTSPGPIMNAINRLNGAAKRAEEAIPIVTSAKAILQEAITAVSQVYDGTGSAPLSILGPFRAAIEHLDEAAVDARGAAYAARQRAIELGKGSG